MRTSSNDVDFIVDNGQIAGVCLGYDYCAEHEWGTDGINSKLGIWSGDEKTETKVWGYDRKKITTGQNVEWIEVVVRGQQFYALTLRRYGHISWVEKYIRENTYRDKELYASWDSNSFAFWSKNKKFMKGLYKAFQENRIAKGIKFSKNPFAGNGLMFIITDFLDADTEKELIKTQKEYFQMWKRIKKSKIEKRLEKAGCLYYALSPRLTDDEKTMSSKLKGIAFWLNPRDQQNNNYGWVTIEDLEDWIEGKGFVPMEGKS